MRKTLLFLCAALLACNQLHAQCTNRCLDFDPTAPVDYVESSFPTMGNSDFTVETRFFCTSSGANIRRLFGFGGNNTRFEIAESGGLLRFIRQVSGGTGTLFTITSPNVRDGQWHHLAATRSGPAVLVYLDGIQVYSTTLPGMLATTALRLGAPVLSANTTTTWDGRIDEVRVWNTARTLAQISEFRFCWVPCTSTGLLAYYRFDQGIPDGNNPNETILEDCRDQINGLLQGFALTGSNSNWTCSNDAAFTSGFCCAAAFTVQQSCGTVTFTNTTPGSFTSAWNFGDGTTSPQSSPTHTYQVSGTYTVTLTITLPTGTPCSVQQTITVTADNTAPTVTCKNKFVDFNNGESSYPLLSGDVLLSGSDNCCATNTLVYSIVGQTVYTCADACPSAPKTVTLVATDCAGNTSTCTAQVQVRDMTPPNVLCKPATLLLTATGSAVLTTSMVDNGSTDNCSIQSSVVTPNTFTCDQACLAPVTVVFRATDCAGNTRTCTAQVTVRDQLPPVLLCPASITLNTAPNLCSQVINQFGATATDNCPGVSTINYQLSGATTGTGSGVLNGVSFNAGVTTVAFTAVDRCINSGACTATVTVRDVESPVILCPPNQTINCNPATNTASLILLPPLILTDNCPGGIGYVSNLPPISEVPCGTITVVHYTATDANGNSAQCTYQVTATPPPGCSCGFSGVTFTEPAQPPIVHQVACGESIFDLGCTEGKTYSFAGNFSCLPPNTISCAPSNLSWIITNAAGTTVASGALTGPDFGATFSGNSILTPGTYTLTLQGACGTNQCSCVIRLRVTGCGACTCGQFTGMAISRRSTTSTNPVISVSLACNQNATMPCPVKDLNWHLTGSFACVGQCAPTNMTWQIKNSSSVVVASGIMATSPFNVFFSGNAISTAGTYTVTLQANCGGSICTCVSTLVVDCSEQDPIFDCGDAVITCYSGNRTGNNPSGVVMAILPVRDRTGIAIPSTPTDMSALFPKYMDPTWTASNMGEIFGVTTDRNQNIYVAATSIYPVDYWGISPLNTGGEIYKIDANSGAVTLFVRLPNSGQGLGNLSYAKSSSGANLIFVTNWDDGAIYRIDLDNYNNNPSSTANYTSFNPFDPDNPSDFYPPPGELLWGIDYNPSDEKLYFGRWMQNGGSVGAPNDCHNCSGLDYNIGLGANEIWSVQLDNVGNFSGNLHPEVTLTPVHTIQTNSGAAVITNPVSDISFSMDGERMLISERSMCCPDESGAHRARVIEYEYLTHWTLKQTFYLGMQGGTLGTNSSGGTDYGYESFDDNNPDFRPGCDEMVWATCDLVQHQTYGAAGIPASGNSSTNLNAYLINISEAPLGIDKRLIGDIDIFKCHSCVETPPCDAVSASILPVSDPTQPDRACCNRIFLNNAVPTTFASVNISVSGASLNVLDITPDAGWSISGFVSNVSVALEHSNGYVPTGAYPLGVICLTDITAPEQTITLQFLDAQGFILCDTTFKIHCDYCVSIVQDTIQCNEATSQLTMNFCVDMANTLDWHANSIVLTPPPGITITPSAFPLPNLAPDAGPYCIPVTFQITIAPGTNVDNACISFTIHEADVTQGLPPLRCCTVEKCYPLLDCCPNHVVATEVETSAGRCCWKFTVTQPAGTAQFVTLNVLPAGSPVVINAILPSANWDFTLNPPQGVTFTPDPSASLPATDILPTVCFEVPDGSPVPQLLEFVWSSQEAVLCRDTAMLDCDPYSPCANIDSIRLICNPGGTGQTYTIEVTNNTEPPVTVTHIAAVNVVPAGGVTGTGIFPVGSLAPGATTTLQIPVNGPASSNVCFQLNLYQQTGPLTFVECCVTEVQHCVRLGTCIPTNSRQSLEIYPNPTRGNVTLRFGEAGSPEKYSIRLRDVMGRLLLEEAIPEGVLLHEVQLPASANGLIFMEFLEDQRRVWVEKLVKQSWD